MRLVDRDRSWETEGHPNAFVRALDLHPRASLVVLLVVTALLTAVFLAVTGMPLSRVLPIAVGILVVSAVLPFVLPSDNGR
jgi:hypothetical protein